MGMIEKVKESCIKTTFNCSDKSELLDNAASMAAIECGLSADTILSALKNREELGSTGFGNGIAIPHCRLPEISKFIIGLICCPQGLDFNALDGEPVKLFVFIVGPENGTDEHIRLLSRISHALLIPGACEEIYSAASPEAARESFLRHLDDEVDNSDNSGHNMFQVIVQEEDIFRDIIEVFASFGDSQISVLEAENAGSYLSKLPLFAGFWTDREESFSRVILATVDKRATNEILRRIQSITGPLDKRNGILVTIQEVFYSAGKLNA